MRTVRRLLYREVLGASGFVMLAFLGLFFFFDLVSELDDLGQRGYTIWKALLVCLLQVPGHVYELAPIAVLIGAIYALARLAQSSEFTILRTGGLGPGRALSLLTQLGVAFVLFTYVVGDFIAPWCDTRSTLVQSERKGGLSVTAGGAWLRDTQPQADGTHQFTINFAGATSKERIERVRIFEFGPRGQLLTRTTADSATIAPDGRWTLEGVRISTWTPDTTPTLAADRTLERSTWQSNLTQPVVAAAVLPLKTMSTPALYTYMVHLSENAQAAQRYEIQFWKKALYPFACLVMMGLALPFAYLHARSGGISLKVFGGVMLGISFVLLNNVSNHLGLLQNWTPWIAASVPSVVYLMLSLTAFGWLVRNR
ncbi:lipopolysaccharide export system permease protein [Sphaerotilus hippei]|uniref:Lipopolysaccharide export system permease protein n=1 Tax=Sphaerotilus hippei TaxID=744406 RepID=A0A318GZ00_9BURK|nr:LPS export ABC transporter permease LptG [Sphaerotilus hippei]PXW94745.1 lipopolysaccharide export system permease protein [Sphaerotilus hippei]